MQEIASSLRKLEEPVTQADPRSRESVRLLIEALVAADTALRSSSPDALGTAARKLIDGHRGTGLAWRKYVAGSQFYDTLKQVTGAFAEDARPLLDELARRIAAQPPPTLVPHDGGYALLCAACGAGAVTFTVTEDTTFFDGLSSEHPFEWRGKAAKTLTGLLTKLDGRAVVERLRAGKQGCDAYCPECDRVYCREHYSVESEWSGSWLSAIHATCPLGHAREIA